MMAQFGPSFRLRRRNVVAAGIVAFIAFFVLIGWAFHVEPLKRVLPGLIAMNPVTALCFLLAAFSLGAVPRPKQRRLANTSLAFFARVAACAIVVVGVVRMIAFAGGPDLRIDQLLFPTELSRGYHLRNIMAPNSALNFFFIGNALLLLHSRRNWRSPFTCIAALVCGFEGTLAVLGYAYGIGEFYSMHAFVPMALHTAFSFLLLAFGVMACQSNRGVLAAITGANLGGLTARRLLPAAILIPAILSWLRLEGQRHGYFGSEFGVAIYTVTNMLVFGGLVACNAYLLFKADAARAKADRRLRRAHAQLEARVAERTAQLAEANAHLEEGRAALEARVRERTATLAESEARLKAVLDHYNAVVHLKDASGRYLLVNRQFEKVFGHPESSVLGKTVFDLFARAIAEASAADDRMLLENGGQIQTESTLQQDDGPHTYVSTKFPLVGAAGNRYAVCCIAHDITRRAATEQALKDAKEEADRANRAKSEFLSRMSHELRTPMNAILGFAQLLEFENLTPDQHESVSHIIRGGRHLLELINEVLDISRIEAGRLTLSIEPVELSELLRETIDLVRPLTADRDLRLNASHVCNCYVLADRQRLKQVLINLVSNAIKYNRIGGSVTILCKERSPMLRIEIIDTGNGIREDQISQLFKPFERLGAQHSTIEGTGLGLAVARRLVEAMQGAIGVESTVGEGSTFWIELPLTESPLVRPELREPDISGQPLDPSERRTLLYVEDNLSNLRLIEQVIAHRPALHLITARSGSEGLQLAREHLPDLVLLDLNLPDIHGQQVLQRLRAEPPLAGIPVIVISADAMVTQKERLLEAGAADYLTKPLNIKKFLDVLDRALEGVGKNDR